MGTEKSAQQHGSDEERATPNAAVLCPFCRSSETELISPFGSQLSTDQYYCRACRTYFERFSRDEDE
jgi:hypothetical protein